jgi:hypothetical protein
MMTTLFDGQKWHNTVPITYCYDNLKYDVKKTDNYDEKKNLLSNEIEQKKDIFIIV